MKGCRAGDARSAVCGVLAGVTVAACAMTPGPALADPSTAFTAGEVLVVGGTGKSVPSESMMHALYEQGIVSDPDPMGVQYPAQLWPIRGKLTLDESVAVGVANLDSALVDVDGPVTVVGLSQGAVVVNYEKRALMAQSDPPADISFVTIGDPTNSDGGLLAKLPHVHIPVLDATIPRAPVETPYDTTEIVHEYDGYADFPDNPLNLLADLNALAGVIYLHPNKGGVDLNDPRNVVTSSTNSLGGYDHPHPGTYRRASPDEAAASPRRARRGRGCVGQAVAKDHQHRLCRRTTGAESAEIRSRVVPGASLFCAGSLSGECNGALEASRLVVKGASRRPGRPRCQWL